MERTPINEENCDSNVPPRTVGDPLLDTNHPKDNHVDHYDSTYSWIVCAAAFTAQMIVVGFSYTIGVYYTVFKDVFGHSALVTSWIASLNFGTATLIGPVTSLVCDRIGPRLTMLLGGSLAAIGPLVCAFANSIAVVFLSSGFIMGLGTGLIHLTGFLVIPLYFDKYRPIAFGISTAGVPVGNMVFPWLSTKLLEEYGWRGAMLITSGLMANVCCIAMLITSKHKATKQTLTSKNNACKVELNMDDANFKNDSYTDGSSYPQTEFNTRGANYNRVSHQIKTLCFNRDYALACIAIAFLLFSTSAGFTHVFAFAKSEGLHSNMISVVVTLAGLGSFAGRLGLSLLVQRHCTNSALVNLGAFLIMTASMTAWGFWTSASGMCICSFWFGFAMSTMAPVHSEVILLVTNSNIYSFALGCSWVFMGLGWVLGAPVAGWLYDVTQFYPASFFLSGAVSLLGAVLLIPVCYSVSKK